MATCCRSPRVPSRSWIAPHVGRLVLDGTRLMPLDGPVLAARRRMLFNGVVMGSLAVDESGRVRGAPRVSAPGLFDPDDPETQRLSAEFTNSIHDLPLRFGETMPRSRMRRAPRCVARSGGGWPSGRSWTCTCCGSDGRERRHRHRALHHHLVDRSVRCPSGRHRPRSEADDATGWRGTPVQPRILQKAIATTLLSAVVWCLCYLIIQSDWLSFRHGWLALPDD